MRGAGDLCSQFSSPRAAFDEAVLDAVVLAHGRAVVEAFVQRHAAELAHHTCGLPGFLQRWLAGPIGRADVLSLAVAQAEVALVEERHPAAEVALRLALLAAARGTRGSWVVRTSAPQQLAFDHWRLPPASAIAFRGDGRHAVLHLAGDGEARQREPAGEAASPLAFTLPTSGGDGWCCSGRALVRPPQVEGIWLLETADVPDHLQSFADSVGGRPVRRVDGAMCAGFGEALRLLRSAGGARWECWVRRVVREVLLFEPRNAGRSYSGSHPETPGLIAASLAHPLRIAEMLVHEASHLYFHVAERVGAVHDGSDATLYYSPAVRRERPLDRVLIAYHAFGNVLRFYRDLVRAGVDPEGLVSSEVARLQSEVAQLEAPLDGNPALTVIGRALFDPLRAELAGAAA